jgi:hypothetical protein
MTTCCGSGWVKCNKDQTVYKTCNKEQDGCFASCDAPAPAPARDKFDCYDDCINAMTTCCGSGWVKCNKDQTVYKTCNKEQEGCLASCDATTDNSFDVDIDGAVVDEA